MSAGKWKALASANLRKAVYKLRDKCPLQPCLIKKKKNLPTLQISYALHLYMPIKLLSPALTMPKHRKLKLLSSLTNPYYSPGKQLMHSQSIIDVLIKIYRHRSIAKTKQTSPSMNIRTQNPSRHIMQYSKWLAARRRSFPAPRIASALALHFRRRLRAEVLFSREKERRALSLSKARAKLSNVDAVL